MESAAAVGNPFLVASPALPPTLTTPGGIYLHLNEKTIVDVEKKKKNK